MVAKGKGQGPSRAVAWRGTLRFPKGAVAKWRSKTPRGATETVGAYLDQRAAGSREGERYFEVQVAGDTVTWSAWDWRADWEQALGALSEVLTAAATLAPRGKIEIVARDGGGRWITYSFVGKKLDVEEGECAPDAKKITTVLDAVRPAFDAWLAAHPDARDRHRHSGLFGYVDPSGQEVIAPRLRRAYGFHEGVAPVEDEDGRARLIDRAGRLSKDRYFLVDECWRGLVPVARTQDEYGYVDREGTLRIPATYLAAAPFRGPLAVVRTGVWHTQIERWITPEGRLVGEPFDATEGFFEDRAWVYQRAHASYACVDAEGKLAFEERFAAAGRFSEGLAAVSRIGAPQVFGYVDAAGRTAIAPRFAEAHPFSEGRAVVRIGKAFHLIDRRGELVGDPFGGAPHPLVSGGMLAVSIKGKIGFVDREGALVIKPRFAEAYGFFEDRAYARVGDRWGHVDREGAFVVPPTLEWTNRFVDGLAPAKVGGLHGFLDRDGRWAIPPRYWAVQRELTDGLAWFQLP